MTEAVVKFLLWLCGLVICVLLVTWVLGVLGIAIPSKVMAIIWVMVGLVAVLLLVRLFRPYWGDWLP